MEQTRRERNKHLCRARILKAAGKLFSVKGYDVTTMEDVAQQAEVSKATLYNYFTSKESLLLGLAETELEDIRQLIESDLLLEPSAVTRLRRVLDHFVLDSINYISLCRKITCLNSSPANELHHIRVQMEEIFVTFILQGQERGELCKDFPAENILELVMGVYLVSQFQWSDIETYSPSVCTARLAQTFDHMLAGVLL